MEWNLQELSALVESRFGTEQKEQVVPLLNTVDKKFKIARYHEAEFNRLEEQYFNGNEGENYIKAIDYVFGIVTKDDSVQSFVNACFIAEANLIAYSHSIHSIFDILGQITIESLNIRKLFKPTQNIYLHTVKEKLKTENIAPDVVWAIEEALNDSSCNYLKAFVNINKHLNILYMPHTVLMKPENEQFYGLRIDQFSYKGETYQSKWGKKFVTQESDKIFEQHVKIGNSLNETLRKMI